MDTRAVDTARLLAADAVQKVGNGHPGTAMSLAPLAYTLCQRAMRHDPSDVHWLGRDRFVLSCGHSSLTLYLQLYLGGFGLELSDIEALRKIETSGVIGVVVGKALYTGALSLDAAISTAGKTPY